MQHPRPFFESQARQTLAIMRAVQKIIMCIVRRRTHVTFFLLLLNFLILHFFLTRVLLRTQKKLVIQEAYVYTYPYFCSTILTSIYNLIYQIFHIFNIYMPVSALWLL